MIAQPSILLVDDNPEDRLLVKRLVTRELPGSTFVDVSDAAGFEAALLEPSFDVVVTDYQLRWNDGIRVAEEVQRRRPACAVVMFTDTGSEEIAVAALKAGVDDYVQKSGKHAARLVGALRSALERRRSRGHAHGEALPAWLDRLDVGAFRLDARGRLVAHNPSLARLLALGPADQALGADFHALVAGAAEATAIARELDLAGSLRRDVPLARAGSDAWLRLQEARVPTADGAFVVEGIVEDVTADRRATDELRGATSEARESSKAKSEFLANMSHEIRTPMNGVLGMAELLAGTELDPDQREYVETIRASGRALLTLINDILDFSKIEAGKLEIEETHFSLRDLLRDVERTLGTLAVNKGLALSVAVSPETPDELVGDPTRVAQVLVNLAGNAIKFTSRGGVTIRARVDERVDDAARVSFAVQDTGIGIPEAQQARIFEAFSQADTSTTRRFGGTGLGLAISARLVGLMGGSITVESRPGLGSTFSFSVRARIGVPATRSPIISPSDLEGVSVLVVEDDDATRRQLVETLAQWKMVCASAPDGTHGLDAFARASAADEPFGVALVDIHLPFLDGFELATRVRADPRHAPTAIVLVTAAGVRGDAGRCRELGIAGYLTKPIEPATLLDMLRSVLSRSAGRELVTRHDLARSVAPLRILLAEDNAVNRKVATKLLERAGHAVVAVEDGRRAVLAVESERFDLVLMDVQMPEMDGFEATAAIRAREEVTGERVPILALTAHAMKGYRERCLDAGMDGHVAKPIQPAQLFALIHELFPERARA